MTATLVRDGKQNLLDITHFELINNNNKFITLFPDKPAATVKDIITIDLKDLQEISIKEGAEEDAFKKGYERGYKAAYREVTAIYYSEQDGGKK